MEQERQLRLQLRNYAGAPTKVGTNLRTGDTTNNVATAFDYRAWGALQKADYANGRRLALGYNQKRGQLGSLRLRKTDDTDVVTNLGYDYYTGGGGSGGNNGRCVSSPITWTATIRWTSATTTTTV